MRIDFCNKTYFVEEIAQYQQIPHQKSLGCECGCADVMHRDTFNVFGYCDTTDGYMVIFECKQCFSKYRHHINIGNPRYHLDSFKMDLGLILFNKDK
jgi:hypothetical protein